MTKFQNLVGPPAKGANSFGRTSEQTQLWQLLETNNVLLLAPRRVGKTSLLYRLRDTCEQHDFGAAYLTAADVNDELAFVERLYRAVHSIDGTEPLLSRLADGPLGRLFKKFTPRKVALAGSSIEFSPAARDEWATLGRALAGALANLDRRALLMIDELPIFVLSLVRQDPTGARARTFLNWMRTLRQEDYGDHTRYLLSGSIGLDTVAARLRLGDAINDLAIEGLGAFSPEVADQFLAKLADSYRLPLDDHLRATIIEQLGWPIPFFLQLFFYRIRALCGDQGQTPSWHLVHMAYEQLLTPTHRNTFDWWRQRLREELGQPESGWALTLLNAISLEVSGLPRDALRSALAKTIHDPEQREERLLYLLRVLEGDGYLIQTQGRFRFRSPLLRDYWTRHVA